MWPPRPDRIQLSSDAPQKHEDQYDHQHQPQAAAGTVAPAPVVTPPWKAPKSIRTKTTSKIVPRLIDYPFRWSETSLPATALCTSTSKKKADVVEHPEVFGHAGLLVNEPPGQTGLPFISSSDNFDSGFQRSRV